MECIRGFSYMPEQKIDMKLQYIEGEELERTWKTTRRQRVKEREQKIWEDFVKEQDVLSSVCKDDPYQFLEQLPEVCLKELMEVELQKMKKENEIEKLEQEQEEPPAQQGDGDSPRRAEDAPAPPAVTFADDDGSDSDVIHIYDDVKDDDQSGPEDETLNDSPGSPPGTVREKEEKGLAPLSPPLSPDKISSKSSENVTSMIESSIYCAKVRDLRTKINEEIMSIINSLELRERDILGIDPEDLVKMCRRSTEFCARFNRIYMYQLHRQIHDVKRNSGAALPFARHTQFQSQMVRVVSLHHNLLQSLQIFHKSFEQTGCVRESADMLRCLARVARSASDTCRAIPPPPHLAAANDLYTDAVLPACDRLDDTINDFAAKISNYMNSTANTSTSRSKKSQSSRGKKSVGTWSKSGSKNKSMAESRLSMYSLDTLRVTMHPKSSSSKDNQSSAGTSKIGGGVSRRAAAAPAPKATTPRKSPRSRRPLMRDAAGTRARGRGVREDNIRTLVEAVEACTSSHISREASPHHSNSNTPRRRNNNANNSANNNNTPAPATPQRSNNASPRKPCISPKKTRRTSPKPAQCLRAALSSIKSADPLATAESSGVHVRPAPACAPPACAPPAPARVEAVRVEAARREPVREPESPRPSPRAALSPRQDAPERGERERTKITNVATNRCEVSRIVRQLCGGDAAGSRNERVLGAKNAQLLCISGTSPRQPSTPQLLRILEETIQKKVPKGLFQKAPTVKNIDRFRLTFNIPDKTAENLFLYRTKFVQHMLASPMYANSIVGKPWEMISSVSEQIIDDLLLQCAEEMQLRDIVQRLYQTETS